MRLFPTTAALRRFQTLAKQLPKTAAERINRKTMRQAALDTRDMVRGFVRIGTAPAAATAVGTAAHELTHAAVAKAFGASPHGIAMPGYLGGNLLTHWFPRFFYTPESMHQMHGTLTQVSHLQDAAISAAPNVLGMAAGGWMMRAALASGKTRPGPAMLGFPLKGRTGRNRKLAQQIYAAQAHIDAHSLQLALPHAAGPAAYELMHQYQRNSTRGKKRPGLFAAGVTLMWNHASYGMANLPGGDFNQAGGHIMAWLNQKIPAIGYHAGWEHAVGATAIFGAAYALYKLPSQLAVAYRRIGQRIRERRQNAYAKKAAPTTTHFENVVQNGQGGFALMRLLKRRKK